MRKSIISCGALALGVAAGGVMLPAADAATNFTCNVEKNVCSCDVNVPRDCDNMKKNCDGGQIGWCNGTRCSCALEFTASPGGSTPPKPGIKGVPPRTRITPQRN